MYEIILNSENRLKRELSSNEKNRLLFLMEKDSIGTRSEYKRSLSEFIIYLRSEFQINELKAAREHISAFKNHLEINSKNSKSTINKKLAVVSSYFRFLLEKKIISENPCEFIKRYRMPNLGKSVAITRAEVEQIYGSLPTRNLHELQKKTMIVLLFETGMRVSELLNLKVGSIKRDFGEYILEFEQKGGVIHRVVLNEVTLSFLGKYLEKRPESRGEREFFNHEFLFVTKNDRRIDRKNFYRMIKSIGDNAGLSLKIHPHTARVSFIRQKHKENMDIYTIRKKVGHSSVRTTERYLG